MSEEIKKMRNLVLALAVFSVLVVALLAFLFGDDPTAKPPTASQGSEGVMASQGEAAPAASGTNEQKPDTAPPEAGSGDQRRSNDEWDVPTTGVVVTASAKPYDETGEAQAILRFMALLSSAQRDDSGKWSIPLEAYQEVVEMTSTSAPTVGPALYGFQRSVMEKGPWQVVGKPIGGSIRNYREETGRKLHTRDVFLLIEQDAGDEQVYYQVMLTADFVYYQSGEVRLSQGHLTITDIARLDEALVPDYREAHGAL